MCGGWNRLRAWAALLAALACLSWSTRARAERRDADAMIDRAIEAYEDLRVEDALDLLERADERGELRTSQRARMHLYRGLCEASLGRTRPAASAFRLALELDADLVLPEDTSPVVVEIFAEARRAVTSVQDPVEPPDEGDSPPPDPVPGPIPDPARPPEPTRLALTWVALALTGASLLGGATGAILAQTERAIIREREHAQYRVDEHVSRFRTESRVAVSLLSVGTALAFTTLVLWLGERPDRRRPALPPWGSAEEK